MAWLPLGNSRDSLRHLSQVYRYTNFNTGTRGMLHGPHIVSRRELIPRILLKRYANFPQAPQEEPFLNNRYVRGTLNLLPHVQWIPRVPDSKESRISFQWLECWLFFHLTSKGMSESSVQSLEKAVGPRLIRTEGLTSLDTSRGPRSSMI